MDSEKLAGLKGRGIEPTTVGKLLGLSPSEVALIDLKLYLAKFVREIRKERGITQVKLAQLMGSSQPRVATIEKGVPPVSLDLMFKALLALDVPLERIARMIVSFKPAEYTGSETLDVITGARWKNAKSTLIAHRQQLEDFPQRAKDEIGVEVDG